MKQVAVILGEPFGARYEVFPTYMRSYSEPQNPRNPRVGREK